MSIVYKILAVMGLVIFSPLVVILLLLNVGGIS